MTDVLTLLAATSGALIGELVSRLVIKPARERAKLEEVADMAAAKATRAAIDAHELNCIARNFVGPVAPDGKEAS